MKKYMLYLIVFLLWDHICLAQEVPILQENKTFIIGIGIPIFKVRDQGSSPLIYKGMVASIYFGYEDYDLDNYSAHKLILHTGSLHPSYRPKANNATNSTSLMYLEYKYTNTRRVGNINLNQNLNTHNVGLFFSVIADIRQYNLLANNVLGFYSSFLNIGPAYRFMSFGNDDKSRFVANADLNLFSLAIRPNYLGSVDFSGFKPSKFEVFKMLKFAPLWKDFIINTDFNYTITHRKSASTFGYNWHYQHNTMSQPLDLNYGGFYYNANFSR